jgi:cell division protein FtsB
MKIILAVILLILIGILQYKLWVDKSGLNKTHSLSHTIEIQKKQNDALKKHNDNLRVDIAALKQQRNTAVEDHARNDLGMIKKGEVFYQIVK